jgi:hypothetical protein
MSKKIQLFQGRYLTNNINMRFVRINLTKIPKLSKPYRVVVYKQFSDGKNMIYKVKHFKSRKGAMNYIESITRNLKSK